MRYSITPDLTLRTLMHNASVLKHFRRELTDPYFAYIALCIARCPNAEQRRARDSYPRTYRE